MFSWRKCALDHIWPLILPIALPETTVGIVHPEPKSREELLKCESIILDNMKQNTDQKVIAFGGSRVFTAIHLFPSVRFEPTMDPNTVYRHMQLSDGDRKATLRAENLNPPVHPERFQFWRQVLCREPLAGSPYYWEVEWTGQKVNP